MAHPVHDHAGLGEGESHECADGVERDQAISDAAEEDEQSCGEPDQNVNAPREEQAASAEREDVGQIAFEGDGAGEAGKIGEGSVSGKREDQQDGANGDVVEPVAARDGKRELGEDALIAGSVGIRRADVVEAAECGDAGEKDDEQGDDDGEGAAGVFRSWIAESHDAVADGFDAGHGGAAAGEDTEQKPEADRGDGRGKSGRGDGGRWMAVADDGVEKSDGDNDQQRSEEKVSGNEENDAGIADAPHVNEGEEQQNDKADLERVRLERRHGRDERTHACGDPDGGGEDVVDHESRGGEQTRAIAEVLTGDGEGAAPVRISLDGLGVGEVEDDEQDEDGGGDGEDEVNACQAERDE